MIFQIFATIHQKSIADKGVINNEMYCNIYAIIIGSGFNSLRKGSRDNPKDSSVNAPNNTLSPSSSKITSDPPTRSPNRKRAIPFFRDIFVPFARRNSSSDNGLIPSFSSITLGTTE